MYCRKSIQFLIACVDILEELTNDILRLDLGISAFGHRIKILNGFKELKASQQPTHMTANTQLEQTFSTLSPPPPPQVVDPHSHIIDLLVLHAAPLLIRDSKDRVFPMEKLDLEKERRAIVNSLLNEIRHKSIHVRFDVATADTLRKLMTAWKCRVLHFSGHGMGQNAALCFEDINGCTHLISPNELRQLIFSASSTEQALQLVFVNSCHSEKVASVFIDAGIPHVIAVCYFTLSSLFIPH
jgi:hypothetical protein